MSCAATNSYDMGDSVRLKSAFTDINDDPVDPLGGISIIVKKPDGSAVEYVYGVDADVIRDSVGVYRYTVAIDMVGTWFYRWVGKNAAEEEKSFYVKTPVVIAP
jgi:hypothetical protein